MSYIVDPLSLATGGLLSDPLTIALDGILLTLEESIVEVLAPSFHAIPSAGGGRSALKKYRKRIVARVVVLGTTYTESIEIDNLTLSLTDVKVIVDHSGTKPIINIVVPR